MSTKPKMGRPKLPKDEIRKVFSTRFSAEQLEGFEKAAKDQRMKLRAWVEVTLAKAAGIPHKSDH